MKASVGHNEKPPGISGRNHLEQMSTYQVGGKTFIVEPVFKQDAKETIGTILINLMRTDASRL